MADLGLLLGVVLGLFFFCAVLVRWNDLSFRGNALPRGTMGWPLLGETIEFVKDPHDFMKNRALRYGNVFKTHLFGSPSIVSIDPEVNRFILTNEGNGVVLGYPKRSVDLVGKWTGGPHHKAVRGILQSLIGPIAIRGQLLPKLDSCMQSYLDGFGGQIVDIQERTREMVVRISLTLVAGNEIGLAGDLFVEEFRKFVRGVFSTPIDLPGTNFRRAQQAKKKMESILGDLLRRKRSSPGESRDIVYSLLHGDQKTDCLLSDEQITDFLMSIVFTGYEAMTETATMALKYLSDDPRVLQEIREEHLEIRKGKRRGEAINWEDYKSMKFTRAVILETLRFVTLPPGLHRRAAEDLVINDLIIPKGWKIFVRTNGNVFDPSLPSEPHKFSPWRWQDKNLEAHRDFMSFGGGNRLCPGKELGIVEISLFLHYFLTRYGWEVIGGEKKFRQFPRCEAPEGFHLRVWDI